MPGYGKYRSPEEKEEFVKQLGADAKQRIIDLAENWEADAKDVAEFFDFFKPVPRLQRPQPDADLQAKSVCYVYCGI